MADINFGFSAEIPKPDDIISCYISKTARYSFSLPLVIGAALAGQNRKILDRLEKLGENLGLIYQIRDDELGIYGRKDLTGKPVGSDISEGKKTLYFSLLLSYCKTDERRNLEKIFGKKPLPRGDLEYVKDLINESGVRETIEKIISENKKSAGNIIRKLPIIPKYRAILNSVTGFILERDK
jgi:geranylgeranyl diphosphate synthase type I